MWNILQLLDHETKEAESYMSHDMQRLNPMRLDLSMKDSGNDIAQTALLSLDIWANKGMLIAKEANRHSQFGEALLPIWSWLLSLMMRLFMTTCFSQK